MDDWLDGDAAEGVAEDAHLERRFATLGYRAGRDAGEEATLQDGFDAGFRAGAAAGIPQGSLEGIAHTLLSLVLSRRSGEPESEDTKALRRLHAELAKGDDATAHAGEQRSADCCGGDHTKTDCCQRRGGCESMPPGGDTNADPQQAAAMRQRELRELLPRLLEGLGVDAQAPTIDLDALLNQSNR